MEAVRGVTLTQFRETMRAGIDELRAAGVEVVLMNMQFSRETDAMIHFEPYLIAMGQAGGRYRRAAVPAPRHHALLGRERLAGSEGQRR